MPWTMRCCAPAAAEKGAKPRADNPAGGVRFIWSVRWDAESGRARARPPCFDRLRSRREVLENRLDRLGDLALAGARVVNLVLRRAAADHIVRLRVDQLDDDRPD